MPQHRDMRKDEQAMKLVKLSEVLKTLETLKFSYEEKKLLVVEQINNNDMDKAKKTFEDIVGLEKAIEQMENLQVQVG